MIHQLLFTNDTIPAAACGCNFQMSDGSVRGAVLPPRPVTVQRLGLALRQVGSRAQAQAFGAQGPALRAVWMALQRTGLALGVPTAAHGTGPQALLMVVVHGAAAGSASAAVLLLAAEDPGPVNFPSSLLLPAVQKAREAAHRATRGGALGLVLVGTPGNAQRAMPRDPMALSFTRVDM
jgi:hypothetical protein